MNNSSKLTLVTGGRRSGKSRYAADLARVYGARVVTVVTGQPTDTEMVRRIAAHQASRPATWQVVEVVENMELALSAVPQDADVVLLDCLSMYVSHRLCQSVEDQSSENVWVGVEHNCWQEITRVVEALVNLSLPAIVVTHEVGEGLAPLATMGRIYADLNGLMNQELARHADRVILMRVGLPQIVKTGVVDDAVHVH